MKFTLEKNPSKIFLFTTLLLLFVIPCRKATNSAGTGARQSASESAQLVDQIRTLNKVRLMLLDLRPRFYFIIKIVDKYQSLTLTEVNFLKGTGSPFKPKVYYLYHNSGHCTHNPVNWQ